MIINYIKKMSAKNATTNRGFTLVETIVALGILLIAVAGPISLIGDAVHKMYYARDEVIAVNLAQESIEMVRQVRDTNMLNGSAWLTSLGLGSASTFIVDAYMFAINGAPSAFIIPCAGCDQNVYIDPTTALYRQGTVFTRTQFSRFVTISSVGLPVTEAKVTSTVTWKTGGTNGTVSVSEYIRSWAI